MIKRICKTCRSEFMTYPYKVKKNKGKFCSKSCYIKSIIGTKQSEESKRKKSIALKGRTYTTQERINHSIAMRKTILGKKLKTPLEKLARTTIEMRLWREAVFARDNWTCQKCSSRGGKINAHHKNNFSEYLQLRSAIDNGITLCVGCHIEFHKIFGKKTNMEQIDTWVEGELTLKS